MKLVRTLHAALEVCEEIVLGAAMIGALLALALQVVSRYVLGLPLAWTEELARYCFVWVVFVGASQVMRYREHIAIALVVEMLGHRTRQAVALSMNVLMIVFLGVLVWQGWIVAAKVLPLSSIALDVTMAVVYLPLPLASAVMILRLIADSWVVLKTGPQQIVQRSL
jgi:TRAP-type C4-dicarboxylate transport system permease small subunit